jgi:predicted ester cyclase
MRSPEGKENLRRWALAFPDNRFTVEDVVAEGSRGAIRLTLRGTHDGQFQDQPPTGQRIEITEMLFCRTENGRLAEIWQDFDFYGLWLQLGRRMEPPGAHAPSPAIIARTAPARRYR